MLSAPRKTQELMTADFGHPVGAGAVIHQGAIVVLDGGFAEPASTSVGLTTAGLALMSVDNSGGTDGDQIVTVRRSAFLIDNSDTDPVDRTHIGTTCFLVDDHTVAATDGAGTRSAAGEVLNVDAAGVWVKL